MATDEIAIGRGRIRVVRGDIVGAGTEAIVNAANAGLAGGGGVDGAIHRAAGPELYEMTRPLGGCPTGGAVITGAGRIAPPTRFIVHAVGPVYDAARDDACAALLRSAYRASLARAEEHGIRSIAFPAISTGVYGYPMDKAAPVALDAAASHLCAPTEGASVDLIVFVLFTPDDEDVYLDLLPGLRGLAR